MGNKKEHDWLLYVLIIGFLISVSLFIIASSVALPLLDVSMIWSGGSFQITFTGIAEIIVAISFAIGIILKLLKK
jgi:hypothetical protein